MVGSSPDGRRHGAAHQCIGKAAGNGALAQHPMTSKQQRTIRRQARHVEDKHLIG
jgi:hypothetical protein